MKRLVVSLLLATGCMCGALAVAGGGGATIELAEVFTDPSRPGLFQTSIPWGEIRVRGHDGTDVLVRARITTDRNATPRPGVAEILERVRLDLRESGNVMELRLLSELQGFWGAELEIELPRPSALSLEVTRGGDVFVEGVAGEVDVSNRNGSVRLDGLGSAATVNARNGSITARFERIDPTRPMSFSTLNGGVDVTFPTGLSADLRIRYNRGGVESDFPVESLSSLAPAEPDLEGLERRATRVLHGRIGAGGPRLYFETANGPIHIRRAN